MTIDPDLEADLKAAREILARIKAGEPTVPWEQVKADLGLDKPSRPKPPKDL